MTKDEATKLFGEIHAEEVLGAAVHEQSGAICVFDNFDDGQFFKNEPGWQVRIATPEDMGKTANSVGY